MDLWFYEMLCYVVALAQWKHLGVLCDEGVGACRNTTAIGARSDSADCRGASRNTVQAVVEHVPEDSNQRHMGTMGPTTGN